MKYEQLLRDHVSSRITYFEALIEEWQVKYVDASEEYKETGVEYLRDFAFDCKHRINMYTFALNELKQLSFYMEEE